MSNGDSIRWGDVSAKFKRELEELRVQLESATIDAVPHLQGRIAATRSLIDWFERGIIAERDLETSYDPHEGRT